MQQQQAIVDVEAMGVGSAFRQGTMCEARSRLGSVMPVSGQRPFQYFISGLPEDVVARPFEW
jgi:hypothetical protein